MHAYQEPAWLSANPDSVSEHYFGKPASRAGPRLFSNCHSAAAFARTVQRCSLKRFGGITEASTTVSRTRFGEIHRTQLADCRSCFGRPRRTQETQFANLPRSNRPEHRNGAKRT